MEIIGREQEIKLLEKLSRNTKAEFLVIYGRRRIGKTFLIRKFFKDHFHFHMTGMANASTRQQLLNFDNSLSLQSGQPNSDKSENWVAAFQKLIRYLEGQFATNASKEKKIIYLDELPWFATKGSDFMMALEHFWNHWASSRNILLIVCGSAASWMVKEVINDKGGLHNRVTQKIKLTAFSLKETEALLKDRGCQIERYQIIQLYMALGGIPYYLDAISPELSTTQNIQALLFNPNGRLHNEFYNLYRSIFSKHDRYEQVVQVLATKSSGMSRKELVEKGQLNSGGTLTTVLRNLEESGFISSYRALDGKKKNLLYRLTDYYTAFYFKYIHDKKHQGPTAWINLIDHPTKRAWEGFTFEQVCLDHVDQIKKGLGISGMESHNLCWRGSAEGKASQVDLLIDRRDQVINLCECKFSLDTFTITKAYAEQLRSKLHVFKSATKTKKSVFLTMITTYGIKKNSHYDMLVTNALSMDVLFE